MSRRLVESATVRRFTRLRTQCQALRREGAVRKGLDNRSLTGQPLSKERGKICRKARDYRVTNLDTQDHALAPAAGAAASVVVVDTNTVLALWWFDDARLVPLRQQLEAGALRWICCEAMLGELAHVMGRLGQGNTAAPARGDAVMQRVLQCVRLLPPPALSPHLRCRDADDQVFIDLALDAGADCLITRDRDLLALRRAAARRRLEIRPPDGWPDERPGGLPGGRPGGGAIDPRRRQPPGVA